MVNKSENNSALATLEPCPSKRNCVCSEDSRERYYIAPIKYSSDAEKAWQRLQNILRLRADCRLTSLSVSRLHAVFISKFLRFRDDVTFRLDADAKLIHVRSASRLGYRDFGVNRARVESLRRDFEESREN